MRNPAFLMHDAVTEFKSADYGMRSRRLNCRQRIKEVTMAGKPLCGTDWHGAADTPEGNGNKTPSKTLFFFFLDY